MKRYPNPLARIKANVIVNAKTGCWEWQGKTVTNSRGEKYGRLNVRMMQPDFTSKHVSMLTHRFVLHFVLGKPIAGLVGGHKCDNPICCNPKHLTAQTQSENMQEMVARGRHGSAGRA